MTISTTTTRVAYDGNGATTSFAVPFPFFGASELEVIERGIASGAETALMLGAHYTVAGGDGATGTVTAVVAPATGLQWVIRRKTARTQATDYTPNDPFPAETHEKALDRLTMIAQELGETADRGLKFPKTDSTALSSTLPPSVERAGKVLAFDAAGNPTVQGGNGLTATDFSGATAETLLADGDLLLLEDTSEGSVNSTTLAILGSYLLKFAALAVCEGRLTLTSGNPITASDVTAATTIYFTPYKGNRIALYDTVLAKWFLRTFSEKSLLVPPTTNAVYDVFAYDNAGALTLEVVPWANDTARATALALQDGVYVKVGDSSRRYLGTFRTTGSSGQTEDSLAKRYLWNFYNRSLRAMRRVDSTATWTYTTSAFRQANGSSANQLDFVIGLAEEAVIASVVAHAISDQAANVVAFAVGIGVDSTSADSSQISYAPNNYGNNNRQFVSCDFVGTPSIGRHTLSWLEKSLATGTTTWTGTSGFSISGIFGQLRG
jgi:hypothetical protein